ncbi:UDP-glucuronosyl/UDP-glucosyltransferase [Arabidopsis thaliana x Arabidopsis arenosa]|uniref:Glycosyltransferase n=1 Tax=Arabidopsis thaliana x Arabidopsis arenosa TaxID=1240361 RepID=A0A8T2B3P9_9BRAS|nr:UDP-glucuronosyl/UDP-glucosyltransferase [Arabidopsis thaliana x Arabidopsis arenosa]
MDQPHALLVASPGLGHLIPILELGNRLSSVLNIHVTILAVTSGSSSPTETEAIRAAAARTACEITELPSMEIEDLVEPNATVATKIVVKMRAMKSKVRDAVESMKRKPTVMIVDIFGTGLMSVADDVGLTAKYVYIPSHAWLLAVMVYLPVLDTVVEGEYVDIKEPLKIPGCKPVGRKELMETMLDRSDQQYKECVRVGLEVPMSDGVLVNTWEELQGNTLAAFREDGELNRIMKVPVYPIGPIVRTSGHVEKLNSIFEWLDKQGERSVVYVCLGSGGTLTFEQTVELAWGLELSGQRFVWVLRRPASYLGVSSSDDDQVITSLPEGFLDRTCGVGLVVTQWAPQVEILSHRSIGGFLSHCGWSSVLESLTKGVPIVAWPLYAEQWMNATLLTEEIGVAVRTSELPSEKVIGREEVASLVRKIVAEEDEEGQKIRAKAEEVRVSSERAWSQGGSSYNSLFEWAKRCDLVS